ncbi:MAG: 16S rRNA (guanine(527)-N(7))-methyltransferase RsmG [Proteobacteria bacterium]|nr:16S rRNA (guanine(527)-N(7))-methyltransferase RsmG [Pseudomonadota bacterium]
MGVLSSHAKRYGIELNGVQLERFQLYLDELWGWNQKINLTGLRNKESMLVELFLDSLIPAPFLPREGRMLDVGSGAGFPGVPLKIHNPRLETDLLEINAKRVSFLRHIIRLMKLEGVRVIRGRIEKEGGMLHPDGYHIITARALAPLPQTVGWCAPFLRQGGILVGFLGARAGEDLKESREVFEKHGLMLEREHPYSLPGKRSERSSVILRREEQGMRIRRKQREASFP